MTVSLPIGIEALVDFAFKKVFASPGNEVALISLLNAILVLPSPIVEIQVLNPFNDKDFEDDKLSIVDLRAEDEQGRIFSIEVQLSSQPGFVQRAVFYGSELYAGQLRAGQDYGDLKPVYTICLYESKLWPGQPGYHHRFHLADLETGLVLDQTIEINLLELVKYNLKQEQLGTATAEERWLYWLLNSHRYTAERLQELFPELAIQAATRTLQNINLVAKDKQMYDLRKKAQLDYAWGLKAAERAGREEGREEGRVEGREEGIEIGESRGRLFGQVQTLQSILGDKVSDDDQLKTQPVSELQELLTQLQKRLRDRGIG